MFSLELLQINLLSPMVLSFFMGMAAIFLKSDLKFPEGMYGGISMYLLLSLGLKGGVCLSESSFYVIFWPLVATLVVGITLPVLAYYIARGFLRFDVSNAAAMAAHYGSVSVVTFMAAQVFVESFQSSPCENYMVTLVAFLEVPGIVVALVLGARAMDNKTSLARQVYTTITGKSIILLLGGIFMGYVSGPAVMPKIAPFFIDPFQGVLVLFMLDMGLLAGQRLNAIGRIHYRLLIYSVVVPLLNAACAIVGAKLCGLSASGATVLATMAASASYIAAPATVRLALPDADPGYYLTSSIALTFPFNLTFGIPIYYSLASWYYGL